MQGDSRRRGDRAGRLDRSGDDGHEILFLLVQVELARLYLGGEQQVADEAQQSVGVALGNPQVPQLALAELRLVFVAHEFEVAEDGAERGAKLVRDQADEFVLEPGDFLRLGLVVGDEQVADDLPRLVQSGGDRQFDRDPGAITTQIVPLAHIGQAEPRGLDQGRESGVQDRCPGGIRKLAGALHELVFDVELVDVALALHVVYEHAEHLLGTGVEGVDEPRGVGADDRLLSDRDPDFAEHPLRRAHLRLALLQLDGMLHALGQHDPALLGKPTHLVEAMPGRARYLVDYRGGEGEDHRGEQGTEDQFEIFGDAQAEDERREHGHRGSEDRVDDVNAAVLRGEPDDRQDDERGVDRAALACCVVEQPDRDEVDAGNDEGQMPQGFLRADNRGEHGRSDHRRGADDDERRLGETDARHQESGDGGHQEQHRRRRLLEERRWRVEIKSLIERCNSHGRTPIDGASSDKRSANSRGLNGLMR